MSDTAEALGHVEAGLKFAYDHGWHELGYDPVETLRAAHSVMAGKVAELEATNKRLVETLRPYLKEEEAIANARQQMRDQLAEERAALAPHPKPENQL